MIHFKYFPKVEYGTEIVTNILVRAKVRDMIKKQTVLYYPHTIADHELPEVISNKYYGSTDYTWLLFYANDIKDPIYDWPLLGKMFDNFIISKYGSIEQATQEIHHYEKDGYEIYYDPTIPEEDQLNFKFLNDHQTLNEELYENYDAVPIPVSNYDYEFKLNEDKRNILIIDVVYLPQIINEMRHVFS